MTADLQIDQLRKKALQKLALEKLNAPSVNVYNPQSGETIAAPAGSTPQAIDYYDGIQNKNESPEGFFGFTKVGNPVEAAQGYVSGIISTTANLATADLSKQEQKLKRTEQLISGEREKDWKDFWFEGRGAPVWKPKPTLEEKAEKIRGRIKEIKQIDAKTPSVLKGMGLDFDEGSLLGQLGKGGTSLSISMAATMITKNPAMASVVIGREQYSTAYKQAREAGLSVEKARTQAFIESGGVAIIEVMGTGALFDIIGQKGIAKRFVKGALQQGTEEFSQEVYSILVKNEFDVTDTTFQEGFSQAVNAFIVGSLLGAPVSAAMGSDAEKAVQIKNDLGVETVEEAKEIVLWAEGLAENADIEAMYAEEFDREIDQEFSPENQPSREAMEQFMTEHYGETMTEEELSEFAGVAVQERNARVAEMRIPYIQKAEQIKTDLSSSGVGVDQSSPPHVLKKAIGYTPISINNFIKRSGGIADRSGELEARGVGTKSLPGLVRVSKGDPDQTSLLGAGPQRDADNIDFLREKLYDAGYFPDANTYTDISDSQIFDAIAEDLTPNKVYTGTDQAAIAEVSEVDLAEEYYRYGITDDMTVEDIANVLADMDGVNITEEVVEETQPETAPQADPLVDKIESAFNDPVERRVALINFLEEEGQRRKDAGSKAGRFEEVAEIPDMDRALARLIDEDIDSLPEVVKHALQKENALDQETGETLNALEDTIRGTHIFNLRQIRSDATEAAFIAEEEMEPQGGEIEGTDIEPSDNVEALLSSTVPMSNSEKAEAPIGESLRFIEKASNKMKAAIDRIMRLNINKNQMDVIFDMLDGGKQYMGENFRFFKRTIDRGWGKFNDLHDVTIGPVIEAAKNLKLNNQDFDKIGAYAIIQQEGGRKKLKDTGYTDEEIDAVSLNDKQMEFYVVMRGQLDTLTDPLASVFKNITGQELGLVDNYFSFLTDSAKHEEVLEVQELFKVPDREGGTDVQEGSTIERTLGKQAVKINAMEVFLLHAENATYYITMAEDIKRLGEVATSKEYKDVAGDFGQEIVVDWLNLMARRGASTDKIKALDLLRKNVGGAILGYKISTVVIQPTALAHASAMIGGDYVGKGTVDIFNKDWRVFVVENMPELRKRVGGDPSFLDFGGDAIIDKIRDAGFWAMKNVDKLAATSVAIGAYQKYIDENGLELDFATPNQDAVDYAQLMVRRTQSSGNVKDAAPIISLGKLTGNSSLDKTILQFQSFMLNSWSLIQYDLPQHMKNGRSAAAMNMGAWLAIAIMAETGIRRMTKQLFQELFGYEPDEDEEDAFLDDLIKQAINNVPIVSQVASVLNYGSVPVPSLSMIGDVGESLTYANRSSSTEKKMKHYTNAALTASGILGTPGVLQVKQIKTSAEKGASDDGPKKRRKFKKKRKKRKERKSR